MGGWEDGSTDKLESPLGHVNFTKKHGPHNVTNIGTNRYRNALTELKVASWWSGIPRSR